MFDLKTHVRDTLKIDPAQPAIDFKGDWISWGQLDAVVAAVDGLFADIGLPETAGVGCVLRNRPPHVGMLLSVIASDRCVVTLNPSLPDKLLADDIRKIRPPVVVAGADDWARPGLREAAAEVGAAGVELTGDWDAPARLVDGLEKIGAGEHFQPEPGIGIYMLTSGTTGTPKRVPLKRSSFVQSLIDAMAYERGRNADDAPRLRGGVTVHNSPLVHISGMFGIVNAVVAGNRVCLIERFSVDEWRRALVTHRPKVASAPPTGLRMIMDANLPKEDFASLVALRSGTAALPLELADEVMERYGLPVLTTYGATEFANVAGWGLKDYHEHYATHRGSVGKVHPSIDARVVHEDTGEVLPFGEEGLLELRAEHIGDGQWLRTTDRAVLDQDRFLWIKGRQDNAIIRGGFKVHAEDVQQVLERHPAVREVSVVGIPDRRLGAVPVAAVILTDGATATPQELTAWARERLIPYQVPVAIKIVDDFPRTPSLKPKLPDVRAMFQADAG